MTITTEEDPTPLVQIMATVLARSRQDAALADQMRQMSGVAVLESTTDKQAVTFRFDKGNIRVERGTAEDADIVIAADLAKMNEPDPPKPKVTGALKKPRFAIALDKVLSPPIGSWTEEAERFWRFAANGPDMPSSMALVNTDTDSRIVLGDTSTAPEIEIHGDTHRLTVLLSGGSVLAEELVEGRLRCVGRLGHIGAITGQTLRYSLEGDQR